MTNVQKNRQEGCATPNLKLDSTTTHIQLARADETQRKCETRSSTTSPMSSSAPTAARQRFHPKSITSPTRNRSGGGLTTPVAVADKIQPSMSHCRDELFDDASKEETDLHGRYHRRYRLPRWARLSPRVWDTSTSTTGAKYPWVITMALDTSPRDTTSYMLLYVCLLGSLKDRLLLDTPTLCTLRFEPNITHGTEGKHKRKSKPGPLWSSVLQRHSVLSECWIAGWKPVLAQ